MNTNTQPCAKTIRPASSIIHRKEGFFVECDMPGVPKENVQLTVADNILTITGSRAQRAGTTTVHRESSGLNFRRSFALNSDIDMTRISARMEAGVLQVFLPHTELPKPRQISVA